MTISKEHAIYILNALREVTDLDARMSCSDAGFRRHFTVMARNPYLLDALRGLTDAMEKV